MLRGEIATVDKSPPELISAGVDSPPLFSSSRTPAPAPCGAAAGGQCLSAEAF